MFWKHFFSVSVGNSARPFSRSLWAPPSPRPGDGWMPRPAVGRVGVARGVGGTERLPSGRVTSRGPDEKGTVRTVVRLIPAAVPPGTSKSPGSPGARGKVRADPSVHALSWEALSSRSGAPGSGERVDVPGMRRHLRPLAWQAVPEPQRLLKAATPPRPPPSPPAVPPNRRFPAALAECR